jgi:hypothetical protein
MINPTVPVVFNSEYETGGRVGENFLGASLFLAVVPYPDPVSTQNFMDRNEPSYSDHHYCPVLEHG